MAGSSSEAPIPPTTAQKTMIAGQALRQRHGQGADGVAEQAQHVGPLAPDEVADLAADQMNAAETRASKAIADWTPLTVVSRSRTTAAIDTFISEVSTTSTNMAIASRMASRWVLRAAGAGGLDASVMGPPLVIRRAVGITLRG
jgi:hypothetical protein